MAGFHRQRAADATQETAKGLSGSLRPGRRPLRSPCPAGFPRVRRGGLGCVRCVALAVCLVLCLTLASSAQAFRLIGSPGSWLRWDSAPRFIEGQDRSLHGGLRYSIETGSYGELLEQFMWVPAPPSEEEFAAAVARAFESWTIVDPASGLPTAVYFVEDLATPAIDEPGRPNAPNGFIGLNPGAEIDVFAEIPHAGPGFAASVRLFVDAAEDDLTLTSGATDYPGLAISGVDIRINPGFVWSLRGFEVLLTHEIGHALGLADLEGPTSPGNVSAFLDDDYDAASAATAEATLGNSFVLSIDPIDPDSSPLQAFSADLNADPGIDTPGVRLLMESEGIFDLLYTEPLLQNDEFAARQFLYPVAVPEPEREALLWAGILGLGCFAGARRWARRSVEQGPGEHPLRPGRATRRTAPINRR